MMAMLALWLIAWGLDYAFAEVEAGSVVAAITDNSRERLNLQDGDPVTVFLKSTEVMIGK
jgi:molybdopterin-binding protein